MLWFAAVPIWGYFVFSDMFNDPSPHGVVGYMMTGLLALILTGIGALPCAGIAALLGVFFKCHPEKSGSWALVTLRDKDGVKGSFFLGSGTIETQPYFFYYKKNPDGSFQPGKVSASSDVRIYEEDRQDASMVEWNWELNKPWAYLIAFPHNTGGYALDFHVPKGTIRTGYTM